MTIHAPEPEAATVAPSSDGRRRRGDRTRAAVLDHAVQRASADGLAGLTFGTLAAETTTTKSAIAGLFGNKEGLEIALVQHARDIFLDAVIAPARAAAPGLDRVWALAQGWSEYSRTRTFAGGCFFRAVETEVDSRPGAVRDAVVAVRREWDGYLQHHVTLAVDAGDLAADVDPAQVVFEVVALLGTANDRSLLLDDDGAYARALAAVRTMLVAHGADPERLR
ncbi:TetR/AcrR family transcriptional regulator [Isoptericola sediminis]|uniref:TetR/AcrR family transcriptional regulator n=1 Tax=Isoptericola sediminis TaxID=2733572 RepID=A0A849JZB5_9MICO|nr:TetR/AcrR family transcriptional regulator [Isoptericola sediminis]NNU28622.1 TetR/AcrR family transcriptional regulator [Isoptericola sediminis]